MYKIILVVNLFLSCNLFAQEFRKDTRSQQQKEDNFNTYQSDAISKIDLLKALEFEGIRIFKFPLSPFDKEYKLTVKLDEYVNGKIISSKNVYYYGKNTYTHFEDSAPKDSVPVFYIDYIDQLFFYTKIKNDNEISATLSTYAGSDGMRLKTRKTRKNQFYNWRHYSKTDWVLNKDIPLLVCASSWYDTKYKIERFCGVVDLSLDEKQTKELLEDSPHYFVISYKVSEK